jgi:hypothetical protein
MKQLSNRKKVMLTLILSAEDNDVLTEAAKEVGLKKSEYLRAIIQGIGAGSKIARQVEMGNNANIEVDGYGLNIPHNVMEELLQDISKKLIEGIQITELEPKKKLRMKRMKSMAKAS